MLNTFTVKLTLLVGDSKLMKSRVDYIYRIVVNSEIASDIDIYIAYPHRSTYTSVSACDTVY